MSIKTGQFIKLYKIILNYVKWYKIICLFFSLQATNALLEHSRKFMVGLLCEKS